MQNYQLQCQIRAFSMVAEMEAMKAENLRCVLAEETLKYNENDYFALVHRLEELAREAGQA